jgi:opacity protein-like surface antigen
MKKILLVILGLALTCGVSAQVRFGAKLGGTLSNKFTSSSGLLKPIKSHPKFGFEVGGLLEYSFLPSFALQPELLYVNNGWKYNEEGGTYRRTDILHNIQVPINLKYKVGTDNLKFYTTAGPYIGFIVAAKARYESGAANIEDLNKIDFGIGAGFGIELSSKYLVGVSYKHGLINLEKGGGTITSKVSTCDLSIGYLF